MNSTSSIVRRFISVAAAVVLACTSFCAQAHSLLNVVNKTGLDFTQLKLVQVDGNRVGSVVSLSNGSTTQFTLPGEGSYQVYATFYRDGSRVYVRGNPNQIQDFVEAELTLLTVVGDSGGNKVGEISEEEFNRH
jgi:hypothetical protein